MPLDKLVLIIVAVIAAAGATIWVGFTLAAMWSLPPWASLPMVSVVALVAYILWRVIAERVGNAEDDHYDGIEK